MRPGREMQKKNEEIFLRHVAGSAQFVTAEDIERRAELVRKRISSSFLGTFITITSSRPMPLPLFGYTCAGLHEPDIVASGDNKVTVKTNAAERVRSDASGSAGAGLR